MAKKTKLGKKRAKKVVSAIEKETKPIKLKPSEIHTKKDQYKKLALFAVIAVIVIALMFAIVRMGGEREQIPPTKEIIIDDLKPGETRNLSLSNESKHFIITVPDEIKDDVVMAYDPETGEFILQHIPK